MKLEGKVAKAVGAFGEAGTVQTASRRFEFGQLFW